MRRPDRTFDTAAEADAFLEGIEFVNDSAITAWIDPQDPCNVCIHDTDYRGDDDEEEEEAPGKAIDACPECGSQTSDLYQQADGRCICTFCAKE